MTRRRHVLVLNHFAVPPDQPGGTRHTELFSRLADWDHTIVAGRLNLVTGEPQATYPGFVFVPVSRHRNSGIGRVLNWVSYAGTATIAGLRTRRPDVVYASSPHLLAGLAGWLVARLRRARFVLEIRDLWPQVLVDMGRLQETSLVYRLLRRLELFLYRQAGTIVVMAAGTRKSLEALGVPGAKIAYVPNGADPADFVPSTDRASLRARYGFERLTGVYTGAHGPANGLELLLDAARRIGDLDLDLVLVGNGVEKLALIERVRDLGMTNVRFLDPVPKSEMPDLLAAADFGIHVLADVELFRTSVSPNKVFDYMAAGLFVVTNSPGVVGDLVSTAGAGLVVTPPGLEDGLRRVCAESESGLRTQGESGRHWVEQNQSRSAMSARLASTLTDLVSAEPSPRR